MISLSCMTKIRLAFQIVESRCDHLCIRRFQSAVANVFHNTALKQLGILQHHAERVAQIPFQCASPGFGVGACLDPIRRRRIGGLFLKLCACMPVRVFSCYAAVPVSVALLLAPAALDAAAPVSVVPDSGG